jgi:hypothetical protein
MILMTTTVHNTAVHQVTAIHVLHAAVVRGMKTKVSPAEVIPVEEIMDATVAARAARMVAEAETRNEAEVKAPDVTAAEATATMMRIMATALEALADMVAVDTAVQAAQETLADMVVAADTEVQADTVLTTKVAAATAVAAEAAPMADAAAMDKVENMEIKAATAEVPLMNRVMVQVPVMAHQIQIMMTTVIMVEVHRAVRNGEDKDALWAAMDKVEVMAAAAMVTKVTHPAMDAAEVEAVAVIMEAVDTEAAAEAEAMADAEDNTVPAEADILPVMETREAMAEVHPLMIQIPVTVQAVMAQAAHTIGMTNKR